MNFLVRALSGEVYGVTARDWQHARARVAAETTDHPMTVEEFKPGARPTIVLPVPVPT